MKVLCVIPARSQSTRLPNKMLADIQGKPLIERTYRQAIKCPDFDQVVVATDSQDIADVVHQAGGDTIMPEGEYPTGSDRVAAAVEYYPQMDIVVNLQGDEPFIRPSMLSELVKPFYEADAPEMSTLGYPLKWSQAYEDPNMVKVIFDQNGDAIYFSRSPIPYLRNEVANLPVLHHIGLYAYKRDFLLKYTGLPQTALEQAESLEQLRALENGYRIRVCYSPFKTLEINNPEDLQRAQQVELADGVPV